MIKKWILTLLLAFSLSTGLVLAEDKVNLNTATVENLQMLDGIGPVTAAAIVEYREANGDFASMDAITDVDGIGDKKAEQLAQQATVD